MDLKLNPSLALEEIADLFLELLLRLARLKTGWMVIEEASGFRLVAARNLPPALEENDRAQLTVGGCTCQQRFVNGRLDTPGEFVECERLRRIAEADADLPEAERRRRSAGLDHHLSVPLLAGGERVGIVNLAFSEGANLPRELYPVLTLAGEVLGSALHRGLLLGRQQRRSLDLMERLLELSRELLESNSLDDLKRVLSGGLGPLEPAGLAVLWRPRAQDSPAGFEGEGRVVVGEAPASLDLVRWVGSLEEEGPAAKACWKGTTGLFPLRSQTTTLPFVGVLGVRLRESPKDPRLASWFFGMVAELLAAAIARLLSQERLRYLSFHDALTGLLNRRGFEERLRTALPLAAREGWNLAIAMVDMDAFKHYNDRFGHPAGDRLLKKAARIMKQQLRSSDVMARIGGDEFALLLQNTTIEGAGIALERIREAIGNLPHAGVSIGAAFYPEDAQSPEELLRSADLALYRSKVQRRVVFASPGQRERFEQRMRLEHALEAALRDRDLPGFALHFQPRYDLES